MSLPTDAELVALQDAAYAAAMKGSPLLDCEAKTFLALIASTRAVRDAILDALIVRLDELHNTDVTLWFLDDDGGEAGVTEVVDGLTAAALVRAVRSEEGA